jgi:hypothetical protein
LLEEAVDDVYECVDPSLVLVGKLIRMIHVVHAVVYCGFEIPVDGIIP